MRQSFNTTANTFCHLFDIVPDNTTFINALVQNSAVVKLAKIRSQRDKQDANKARRLDSVPSLEPSQTQEAISLSADDQAISDKKVGE